MDAKPSRKLRFSKPKNIWQWLMLFTPAAVIFVGAVIARAGATNSGGGYKGLQTMVSGLITGPIGAVMCLGLGFWLARESNGIGQKIAGAMLFGIALAAVNLAIGFPGCLLVSSR